MNKQFKFYVNKAIETEIKEHLQCCDAEFVVNLRKRVELDRYAHKITGKAVRFEAWIDGKLIGLVSIYCNDNEKQVAYITNVSVLPRWQRNGVAKHLLRQCLDYVKLWKGKRVYLEIHSDNVAAKRLYGFLGFVKSGVDKNTTFMCLTINNDDKMKKNRDYDSEINDVTDHKYAYHFDVDVMHSYMLRSFKPFFLQGNLLELGSFNGEFTRRFLPYFDDITCVEASSVAIGAAKEKLGNKVKFVNTLFEEAVLPTRYNNVIITHVLEHLDDPVLVLKRIREEWLTENGRCFLVCPNANAPSRQIAVKMGIITHNTAVTEAERVHGHRCTYCFDTLERDAVAAGLSVIHRSGIFFKALANFQWDELLDTDILSKEYLDGCYELGQQYPDLCSSIFLMCEKR